MAELDNMAYEDFAKEYLVDYNATQAGIRCGFSEAYGRDLIRKPAIKARIIELRDELTERTEITADRIARSYSEIAFYDGRDMARVLDALSHENATEAAPTSLHERLEALPRAVTAPIRKLSKRVDNKGVTYTVEAYDRHKALDVLSDRFWSVDEAHDGLIDAIQAMRERGVPDMSEDNAAQTTDDAADVDLNDIPDTTGDEPNPPKWRKRRA